MNSLASSEAEMLELTPAVIRQVEEGLAAARDPQVKACTKLALRRIEAIAQGKPDARVNGRFRRWLLRGLLSTLFNIQIEFPDRIPQGPVVLVANHISHLDPLLILASVPHRPYYYILGDARAVYDQLWKRWIVGNAGGVIPLERWWKEEMAVVLQAKGDRPDLQALAQGIEQDVPKSNSIQQLRQIDLAVQAILKRGDGLLLFPEGRLGNQERRLHVPLRRGTVIYSMRSGVPIVPVVIIGAQKLHFRKTLILRFGEPIPVAEQPRPKRRDIDQTLAQLEQALRDLLIAGDQEPKSVKPAQIISD